MFEEVEKNYTIISWDGPEPEGSYVELSPFVRMSTPEFMFLRKANELPFMDALQIGIELCGKYRTTLTCPTANGCEFLKNTRTTTKKIYDYLTQIEDTEEGEKALEVLDSVIDESGSPVATYLYLLLCLPMKHGGMGMPKPHMSAAYYYEGEIIPRSFGSYLAYDMCWPDANVAVQYVGDGVSDDDMSALTAHGMYVFPVSDGNLSDEGFMHEVFSPCVYDAVLGGFEVGHGAPSIPAPKDRMRLTFEDIHAHM